MVKMSYHSTDAPSLPLVCLDDFEKFAYRHLDKNALDYYRSGADEERTLKDNRNAFVRYLFRPRVLVDVSRRDVSTTVLGEPVTFPVGISPTAMNRMAHSDGEVAVAAAAASVGTCSILSTIATSSIEEVETATARTKSVRWFQLYIYKDRDITRQLVERAERSGCKALVLTIDTPFFGKRRADTRNKFKLPSHLRMKNFDDIDIKSVGVQEAKKESGLNEYAASLFDPSITWADVDWLRSITKLPIVAKGILTGAAAKQAVSHGCSGVLVSNHGARQLDHLPATIDALEEVVAAVRSCGGGCEVYIDGGIRTGTDVLKCLALGARAVFIGRPAIWALAYNGEAGVKQMLDILKTEFDTALALSGCRCVSDIKRDLVVHRSYYTNRLSKL